MFHRLLLLCLAALAAACASPGGPREPVRFQSATRSAGSSSFPNWAEPPDVAMEKMAVAPPVIESIGPTATGTSGAEKVGGSLAGSPYKVKEKRVPPDLDGINNAPRKELAAYTIQRLFLDPEDYAVPATTVPCTCPSILVKGINPKPRHSWHFKREVGFKKLFIIFTLPIIHDVINQCVNLFMLHGRKINSADITVNPNHRWQTC